MGNWWDGINDPVAPGIKPSQQAAAGTTPGTMDYYTKYASQPSNALPNPGDPTSFSQQGSSAGLVTPSRISDDTLLALGLNAAEGGKNSASILNNDPGSAYAKTYATSQANNAAAIDLKQKMTRPMLDIVHGMEEKLNAAGPDIADKATGPDYGALSDDPGSLERGFKSVLPDTSGEFYQNARAGISNAISSIPGITSLPLVGGVIQDWADSNNKARDLNLELHHLTKGIGAGVKAIPGVKGGGTSTDADQALVLDAVGEAMHAANTPTRNSILYDAENILRARAGMSKLPPPPGYQPSYISNKYSASVPAQPPQASAPSSAARPSVAAKPMDALTRAQTINDAKKALAAGADRAKVLQRLKDLGFTTGQ